MENKADLIKLFKDVAEKHKFSAVLLEKDYHLTRILHKFSERQTKDLVFKGGTCLNKCYLGFYRLSEDLDFTYNRDVKDLSKSQIKKTLDQLRRQFIEILDGLGFKTNKELGKGWKMLTSKTPPKIIGLEIITDYKSLIDNSPQEIKIEISFRKKLRKPVKTETINHKFIDALGEPVLKKDIEIEVADLVENFAEKFRALITRKRMAVRDVYDIHFILKNEIIAIDKEVIDIILIKLNESKKFTKKDLIEFIRSLNSKVTDLDEKEIAAVIKTYEKVDFKKMAQLITKKFDLSKTTHHR